jgi:predicted Fe-Mo cluster-binding NifX family protein
VVQREQEKLKRIAVCHLHDRVCPRFDQTREILIYDINQSDKRPIEKLDVSHVSPERIMQLLTERKVKVIISGGIQERFQVMFLRRNVDVIWGIAGNVKDVVHAYLRGTLRCGMGILERP